MIPVIFYSFLHKRSKVLIARTNIKVGFFNHELRGRKTEKPLIERIWFN
jgi:hypothetical protein